MVSNSKYSENREIISEVIGDGILLDLVLSEKDGFRLAVWNGEEVTYCPQWTYDGTIYIPLELKAYQECGVMRFPEEAADVVETEELRDEIASFYGKYFYADERLIKFMAEYAMLTWVQDRFQAVPYLRFLGSSGTGKTRALELMHLTCYKSLNMGVGPTVSPLFRNIDRLSPTLMIDEADWPNTSEHATITQILNAGYKKDGIVWRSEKVLKGKTESFQPTPFRVYGCKVIASRHRFSDEALESRCITFELHSKEIPNDMLHMPPQVFSEAQELRNKLLGWRLRNWEKVHIRNYPETFSMEARFKECFQPLYSLFGEEILEMARTHREGMKTHLSTTQKADVIIAIEGLQDSNSRIYMKDIGEEAGIDAQTAGKIVKGLGFRKGRDQRGVYLVEDEGLLDTLESDYYLSPSVEA